MRANVSLVREPTDRTLPRSIFVPKERKPHRPCAQYEKVVVRSEDDARIARNANVPLFALDAARVTSLGYPIKFPPLLVVARSVLPLIQSSLTTIPFASEEAARSPRPEDVAVAMLKFDRIGARALVDRNPRWDPLYLTRRIWEENALRVATLVRLFDVLPYLPRDGDAPDRAALERKLWKNPAGSGF
ncbi:MAG TPA: hypothetical protein VMG81_03915 [Thermoplasmata archaeon]|nr:hypothetical protein [Thermoplasmata archaeon]